MGINRVQKDFDLSCKKRKHFLELIYSKAQELKYEIRDPCRDQWGSIFWFLKGRLHTFE